jgi:putative ABC transport system permease protein
MLFGEMVVVALQSIWSNAFRGILTMLGIIIGVGSVIAMIAISAGARKAIDEQIQSLGTDIVTVSQGSRYRFGTSEPAESLTIGDATAILADGESVVAVIPEQRSRSAVKFAGGNHSTTILGTTPNFSQVLDYGLQTGRLFTMAEMAAKKRVAVVGASVPDRFGSDPYRILGETVYLQDIAFEIVGVLGNIGSVGSRNFDEQIWVPLYTSQYRIAGSNELDVIKVQIAPDTSLDLGMFDIERVMRREHRILPGKDNDFSIGDPAQYLNVRNAANNVFGYLLAGIASVSLIVGGIGIMNIMLVTVSERSREIGLRKAMGATNVDILMQFVVEALVLCLFGGLLGIFVGIGTAELMSRIFQWDMFVSTEAIVIAVAYSAVVGLLFGIWPARTAAKLDPIETLRAD